MKRTASMALILGALAALLTAAAVAATWSQAYGNSPGKIVRVSVAANGDEATGKSSRPSLSYDGRFVAFSSIASNLVAGDTNGWTDVFVRDTETGTTERVSLAHDGAEPQGGASGSASISADGRFVAFFSFATNLVPNDTNGWPDIFVRDRGVGRTEIVSIAANGDQANLLSFNPSISADGRFIAFDSLANNLVPGDTNNVGDVFVYDRTLDTIERISITSSGDQAVGGASSRPSISADGRYVAFESLATNLYANDTNNLSDVFVHDRDLNLTVLISAGIFSTISPNGASTSARMTADGRGAVFRSTASNLVEGDTNGKADIFIHLFASGTAIVSVDDNGNGANGASNNPAVSGDGRFVAFDSLASNLVPGKSASFSDIFVHDRLTDTTRRLSVGLGGADGAGESRFPAMAADGRYLAFESEAPNLVPNDTNEVADIFYVDYLPPQVFLPAAVRP